MSGISHTEAMQPLAKCGCGGKAIIWERDVSFTGKSTVEAWCSKHCGINVQAHVIRSAATIKKVARIWNRAMGATK